MPPQSRSVACERPRGRCAPARRTADRDATGYIVAMENAPDLALSPSERRTLQHLSEGELHASELDWVALQRLKSMVSQRIGPGVGITKEGRRVLRRLMTTASTLIAEVDDRACAARLHPPVPACPLPEDPGRRRLPDRRAKQSVPRHTTTIAMALAEDEGMEAPSCPGLQGDKVAPNSLAPRKAARSAASTASAAAMTRSSWPRAASNRSRPRAPGLKTN